MKLRVSYSIHMRDFRTAHFFHLFRFFLVSFLVSVAVFFSSAHIALFFFIIIISYTIYTCMYKTYKNFVFTIYFCVAVGFESASAATFHTSTLYFVASRSSTTAVSPCDASIIAEEMIEDEEILEATQNLIHRI